MPPPGRVSLPFALALLVLAAGTAFTARPLLKLATLVGGVVGGVIAVLAAHLWVVRVLERRGRERRAGGGGGGGMGAKGQRGSPVQPLYFTSPAAWSSTQIKAAWEAQGDPDRRSFPSAPPFLNAALNSLLALILRDFVGKWYSTLSDSPAFPNAVEGTIRDTLLTLSTRIAKVDFSDLLVGRILPLLTSHLETFRIAEHSVHGRDTQLGSTDELDLFVASRYAGEIKGGKLHPAVNVASTNSHPAEEEWLRGLVDSILPLVLPEAELDSFAVRVMVREIVACAVMLPIFDMLSDPDFYNHIIDDKAGAAIRDQRMVDEFRAALDKQNPVLISPKLHPTPSTRKVPSLPSTSLPPPPPRPQQLKTEAVTVRTGPRQFETWLKSIKAVRTVVDAKRLRSDVSGQIRRAKGLTEGKNPNDEVQGVKVSEWIDFIERLHSAKRKVDRRIVQLGGEVRSSRASEAASAAYNSPIIPLRQLLLDPTAVSYFTEYLDRRNRSVRVQFWILVEGLKDPLEDVDSGDSAAALASSNLQQEAAETALEDVKMIWETYLVRDPFSSNARHLWAIRSFVESGSAASLQDVRRVRHALFAVQGDVFSLLEEEDYPGFVRSDLYFKALADSPVALPASPLPPMTTPPSQTTSLPPTRPRSRSNPHLPPLQLAPTPPITRAASPNLPSRPASPAFPYQATFQRTETAPPQVTFHAAFDRSSKARRISEEKDDWPIDPASGRKISSGSLDHLFGPGSGSGSASSTLANKRRSTTAAMSDSLEFLMSPPAEEVDRSPLFAAEPVTEEPNGARGSDDDYVQVQTIEAIQDALHSILSAQPPLPNKPGAAASEPVSPTSTFPRRVSADGTGQPRRPLPPPRHPSLTSPTVERRRLPSNGSSVSLPVSTRSRSKGVFDDDELFDTAPGGVDEDDDDPEPDFDRQNLKLAAPGDLNLHTEIARLADSLTKLESQEAVVGALIRKAELTGNSSELKLLTKSRESLRREIRAATFQKEQYEAQASENRLSPERTKVSMPGTTVGQAAGGQSFQLYLVEVHQLDADGGGAFKAGWIVTRRYSEFATLSGQLAKFPAARGLDFPSKRLVGTYSKDFIEQRRIGLERYLQALVKIPAVCQSSEFRTFLSQATIALPKNEPLERKPASGLSSSAPFFVPGQTLVRTLYRSLTSGIDDVLGTSTTSMMDQIIERLSQQAAEFAGLSGSTVQDEDLVGQLLGGAAAAVSSPRIGEEGLTSFTAPIADLFVTVFELKEKNNWLRRQAILIVLQQVLGGTIERKFRDSVKLLLAPPQLVTYISSLQNSLWPGGELKPKSESRTPAEKAATKEAANRKLATLMPDVAANLIGRHNARQGARRLFSVVQNQRLTKHLLYSIVDEVVAAVFPELNKRSKAPLGGALGPRPLFLS
ncbi:hypothetical protein JCM8097_002675 [Rhodosporidiobolus ruineniae]